MWHGVWARSSLGVRNRLLILGAKHTIICALQALSSVSRYIELGDPVSLELEMSLTP